MDLVALVEGLLRGVRGGAANAPDHSSAVETYMTRSEGITGVVDRVFLAIYI